MNKHELKIQALREALREKVSSITDEYENKIADLRVELTEVSMALQDAQSKLSGQTGEDVSEEQQD